MKAEIKANSQFTIKEIEKSQLESAIGNTPLIRLRTVTKDLPENVEVYAKAEHLNPGGSVKDRAALAMILVGEQSGQLTVNKTILDATSGNTGIAYAMLGAARDYKVALTPPKNASAERKRILKLYGAEIIETDQMQGTDGAQIKAKELFAEFPENTFIPTNTTTKIIGKRIIKRLRRKFGRKPTAKSHISSPDSERPEHSSAQREN